MFAHLHRWLPQGPFVNPITTIFENFGLIAPTLIAFQIFDFLWPETDDDGITEFYPETSTIYLMEFPSGRRDYRVYEYGHSKAKAAHEMHMPAVMAWIYGGPLPRGYQKPGTPSKAVVVPLRLITPPAKV